MVGSQARFTPRTVGTEVGPESTSRTVTATEPTARSSVALPRSSRIPLRHASCACEDHVSVPFGATVSAGGAPSKPGPLRTFRPRRSRPGCVRPLRSGTTGPSPHRGTRTTYDTWLAGASPPPRVRGSSSGPPPTRRCARSTTTRRTPVANGDLDVRDELGARSRSSDGDRPFDGEHLTVGGRCDRRGGLVEDEGRFRGGGVEDGDPDRSPRRRRRAGFQSPSIPIGLRNA